MFRFELNTSNKFHLNLGFFISCRSTAFLIIMSPYDVENLSLIERILKMPIYGLILFLSYSSVIYIQDYINKKDREWTVISEFYSMLLFGVLVLIGSFFYYQSNIIRGGNDFGAFFTEIFLPIFLIISFILLFLRFNYKKRSTKSSSKQELLFLTGENKFDILKIRASNLICIFSAGNYVEIYYLIDDTLHKKLIRSTLKKVHYKVPYLKKVHRSRLINPEHIVGWKDGSTLILTKMEVGVSKRFIQRVTRP